jgi:hypothetical protein
MRRAGLLLVVALTLGSSGCLRFLFPDFECSDECLIGTTGCYDDYSTGFCMIEPFFGCLTWYPDEDCGERNAVCVLDHCECSWGFFNCEGTDQCIDTSTDRWNCGACGVACPQGVACVDGTCRE